MESITDFAVLAQSTDARGNFIKAPIIYTGAAGTPKFQTAGGKRPTLVSITQKLKGKKTTDPIETWTYVVEPLVANDAAGISHAKLKLIKLASGAASDGAEGLSSLIMRSFGGVDIGFVVLGKISIGDNETLARIVETVVGNLAIRSSEMAVSHGLYEATFTDSTPDFSNDSPAVLLLKVISRFDD
jgi:hypothetical protein